MKGFTTNKTELARECGFQSRQGLYEFMAKADWPKETLKGWNIAECRNFVLNNTEKESIAASLNSDISDLKKWDIYERARKTKLLNDHKSGIMMLKTAHETEIREMSSAVQKAMYALPARAPELAGLSVPDIEQKLTAWMDEVVINLGKE